MMRPKTMISVFCCSLTLIILMAQPAAAGKKVGLKGTSHLGGQLAFVPTVISSERGNSVTVLDFNVAPEYGYFVIDGLELMMRFDLSLLFADEDDLDDNLYHSLGLGFGLRYLIITSGSIHPYLGLLLGPSFAFPKGRGDTSTYLNISPVLGMLWALNQNVALKVGLEARLGIALSDQSAVTFGDYTFGSPAKTNVFSFPMGFLGVEAFF